jgi:RND superfamily putative drug exporter
MGVVLAVAVLLDMSLVRLLLLPVALRLLGARAWWLPQWLDKTAVRGPVRPAERRSAGYPSSLVPAGAASAGASHSDRDDRRACPLPGSASR